jgi:hypothetical protein
MGLSKSMITKELIFTAMFSLIVATGYGNCFNQIPTGEPQITRITHSEDAVVKYPSLSNDGQRLLYISEIIDPSASEKRVLSVRIINTDGTQERVLFADKTIKAPYPQDKSYLFCGTRPPQLSGDGTKAVFSLSIKNPVLMEDHYLGVINTDGTGLTVYDLKNEKMPGFNWQQKGFKDDAWRRISNYSMSDDGRKLVLLVKGHHGPRKFGFPSAILVMNADGRNQRTLFSPDFGKEGWEWRSYPSKPCTEGGWAFAFSGDGKRILFGARSSAAKDDFDLYLMNWDGSGLSRVTDFKDRFFTLADISNDGQRIIFFYAGKKHQGPGTYLINSDGTGLKYLRSKFADRIDFEDMDPNGNRILYRHKYFGIAMDLDITNEVVVLRPGMPGYAGSNETFMDFPYFPSFWNASIMTENKAIITGTPQGRSWREFYLLKLKPSSGE